MLAYFDCFAGISGDMCLGALIDLGMPLERLMTSLKSMPLDGFKIDVQTIHRHGIGAKQVQVHCDASQPPRNYQHITNLIDQSPLPQRVKKKSQAVFKRIALAESEIHGVSLSKVHFHEVGAVDALVDIIGAMLCIEYLKLDKIVASKIPLGCGFVQSSHGTLPVPAPATLSILKNVPVYGTPNPFEMTTPTGAAIISELAESFDDLPEMIVSQIGYGAGQREFEQRPNLLRVVTGKATTPANEAVYIVETSIDDMNPEIFGYLMESLFDDGALDVYWIPIYMKKNRPGTLVQVVCKKLSREAITKRLLSESTSLGVRFYEVQRQILAREPIKVQTAWGELTAKRTIDPDGHARIIPEYEECRRVAKEIQVPIRKVFEAVLRATIANET